MYREMSIEEAEAAIAAFAQQPLRRSIRFIDTHHTYKPARAHWRGRATVEAMAAFHRSLGWSAIGQHWSIGPDGSIWTGRDLNALPCSQTGFNTGALMYEMVGNFCRPGEPGSTGPYDTLDGPQLEAAVAVSAAVLANFHLPLSAVRFHRQLHLPNRPPPKTCPGLTVDWKCFADLVEQRCYDCHDFDPTGGKDYAALEKDVAAMAAAAFNPGDMEGSGEPEPEALLAFLEGANGTALA